MAAFIVFWFMMKYRIKWEHQYVLDLWTFYCLEYYRPFDIVHDFILNKI